MRIMVSGGNGFLGRRLLRALSSRASLRPGGAASQTISEIVATDLNVGGPPAAGELAPKAPVSFAAGDLVDRAFLRKLTAQPFDVVFHLASLVSGGAEEGFDAGMQANLWATAHLLEECRKYPRPPVFVFTSSIAVYGGRLPQIIGDDQAPKPESSYGVQKAAAELLIQDYSRKGYLDGRSVRLPIVIIRPGGANTAVSGFASALFREPLQGRPAQCPLADDDQVCIASAASSIDALIRAAESPAQAWGDFRAVMLPGRTVRIDEMLAALQSVAGAQARSLVSRAPDPVVQRIVRSWPTRFDSPRARDIGFAKESSLEEIIADFMRHDIQST